MLVVGAAAFMLARPRIPAELADLPRAEIRVGATALSVVMAVDHARGLMGVADLGELDGMLFAYDAAVDPAAHRFWMQGVLIPLDVAFFDAEGVLVSQATMAICPEADQASRGCPLYAAEGPFRWALETEAGSFRFEPGVRLEVHD